MKEVLSLYKKDTFSVVDEILINNCIELGYIYTDEIKEDFMDYMYKRLDIDYPHEDIWSYTDENYSNGLTHKENYNNLIKYLNERS